MVIYFAATTIPKECICPGNLRAFLPKVLCSQVLRFLHFQKSLFIISSMKGHISDYELLKYCKMCLILIFLPRKTRMSRKFQ